MTSVFMDQPALVLKSLLDNFENIWVELRHKDDPPLLLVLMGTGIYIINLHGSIKKTSC